MIQSCECCYPEREPDQTVILSNTSCMFLQLKSAQHDGEPLEGAGIIVPRAHRETVFDLTEREWQDTYSLLQEVKGWIDNRYQPEGYNIGWNCGSVAGQHVFHAHMHVLPRYKDEPLAGKGIRYLFKSSDNSRK
ncbi:HIT family protein [Alkalicoccobacillus murimartini]|uniref:Histidine triad (HIT) family protein n=1 Tax=Alkalicoccobacillus murimartini TaxID=171685 RepID=A0ABT9YLP2_9BACI|nr:HIT domain-containing protein [Alkalicoccobacillus murimartini]MDQ0208763.1 histidine triad (HIT) family protein [Alkalicoccobacillus murimartini]